MTGEVAAVYPSAENPNNGDRDGESVEEVRAQIEHTRSQLGDTVQALAEKADVKAQAQRKLEDVREKVRSSSLSSRAVSSGAAPRARQLSAEVAEQVRARPVAAVAMTAALGFVLGRLRRKR